MYVEESEWLCNALQLAGLPNLRRPQTGLTDQFIEVICTILGGASRGDLR